LEKAPVTLAAAAGDRAWRMAYMVLYLVAVLAGLAFVQLLVAREEGFPFRGYVLLPVALASALAARALQIRGDPRLPSGIECRQCRQGLEPDASVCHYCGTPTS
jgi:hypothetical protein